MTRPAFRPISAKLEVSSPNPQQQKCRALQELSNDIKLKWPNIVAIDQIGELTPHLFAELMDLFAAPLDFPSRQTRAKRKCRSLFIFLAYFGKVTTFSPFYFYFSPPQNKSNRNGVKSPIIAFIWITRQNENHIPSTGKLAKSHANRWNWPANWNKKIEENFEEICQRWRKHDDKFFSGR